MPTVDQHMQAFEEAMERDDVDGAMKCLDAAIALDPTFIPALGVKGSLLAHSGDDEAALACFERICEIDPTSGQGHYSRGLHLQNLGRIEDAIDAYTKATETSPDDPDGFINRGRLLDDSGDPKAALADYDRALALKDDEEIAWSNRGNSLCSLERFEEAAESYRRAIELAADHAPAQLGLSAALMSLGRIEEANQARPLGTSLDTGDVRELTHGDLVLRYYPGEHSAPEQLEFIAQKMLEHCASFSNTPPGIKDGVHIQYGWSLLTVRAQDGRFVLCEPDFTSRPLTQIRYHVTFTLQTAFMMGALHSMVDAPPSDCSYSDLITVERGSLERKKLTMRRVAEAANHNSGWIVGQGAKNDLIPTAELAARRPHLIKVLTLPAGYVAQFEAHAVVSIRDPRGRELLPMKAN